MNKYERTPLYILILLSILLIIFSAGCSGNMNAPSPSNDTGSPVAAETPVAVVTPEDIGDNPVAAETSVAVGGPIGNMTTVPKENLKEFYQQAQFAFSPIKIMTVDETETISVYIDKNVTRNISEEFGLNEPLESEIIPIKPRMRVSLSESEPETFYIQRMPPNSNGEQDILEDKTNIWNWQVTPRKYGDHTLILSVEGYYKNDFVKFKKDITRVIKVKVHSTNYFKEIMSLIDENLKIIASIIGSVVVILGFWAFIKQKNSKEK
jgi:hypothetical protein